MRCRRRMGIVSHSSLSWGFPLRWRWRGGGGSWCRGKEVMALEGERAREIEGSKGGKRKKGSELMPWIPSPSHLRWISGPPVPSSSWGREEEEVCVYSQPPHHGLAMTSVQGHITFLHTATLSRFQRRLPLSRLGALPPPSVATPRSPRHPLLLFLHPVLSFVNFSVFGTHLKLPVWVSCLSGGPTWWIGRSPARKAQCRWRRTMSFLLRAPLP